MEKLWDLYLRYDGPLPRHQTHMSSPVCWEMMMRAHLRAIRIKRHSGALDGLEELTERIGQIHGNLRTNS